VRARGELFAQEALEVLPPVFVRLRVQIKTDDRQARRLERGEAFNSLLKCVALGCATLCHLSCPPPLLKRFSNKRPGRALKGRDAARAKTYARGSGDSLFGGMFVRY